ncbi:MAG TPA: NAD(P)-binding oxidoreductase [Actinoplanes sp.]|nr:NAD(P)-binding oxidoreductase [Actinoplanes sp.]
MRITVFGATGGTGQHLVVDALTAGHEVTAVVRGPSRLTIPVTAGGARPAVVTADVLDPAAIEQAVAGRDVIISALGPRPKAKDPICAPGAESIIAAMRATGVRRLVVITASGHVRDRHDDFATRALAKPILRRLLRAGFADFTATDELVTASGLDWTIMRPVRLTDGGHKPYRTAVDHTVRGGFTISRADLADATLAAASDPATAGHAVAVAY